MRKQYRQRDFTVLHQLPRLFINYLDNPSLDHAGTDLPGYTVFGLVVEGIEAADRIALVPTAPEPGTALGYVPAPGRRLRPRTQLPTVWYAVQEIRFVIL